MFIIRRRLAPTAEDRMGLAALALVLFILLCCFVLGGVMYAGIRALYRQDARPVTHPARQSLSWVPVLGKAPARAAE